ncbi:Crp/Fnr family transcriptional regulator [Thermodesulfobacteriota bacterium]
MTVEEIQQILQRCELFQGLSKKDIESVSILCRLERFQVGEPVFQQGDFGDKLYIIAEGQVALERNIDLGARKGRAVMGLFGAGRAFGCWSTLLDEAHNLMSSVVCRKQTRVVVIDGAALRQLMVENVQLGFNVLEKLCFMLRDRIQSAYGAMDKI